MKLKKMELCRWLQLFLGLLLLEMIDCDCKFPGKKIDNGRYLYASKKDAKEVWAKELYVLRFRCFSGYKLEGPNYIQCLDGEWTDEVPFCEKMLCSDPPEIANGTYELYLGVNKLPTIGAMAAYSCEIGYDLEDTSASNLVCVLDPLANKTVWSGKMPSCQERKTCPDPGVSKHGSRKGDCCFAGNVLQFLCEEDYELIGDEEILCLTSGRWSSGRPLCKPAGDHCELPPAIPHGVVTGDKEGDYFLPNEEAEILCLPGYRYVGSSPYILCEDGGQWEDEFGKCTEIFCDLPEPLINGTILELESTNLTSFPYNFELTYICDEGYRLFGGDSWRICGKKGWSGKTPYCDEIRCPDPGVPEHGQREGDSFEVGSKLRFKCSSGYYLLGSFERYCMPNGQWTGELSRCDTPSNHCPNPGTPINGFKNSSSYNVDDAVGFRCYPGYIHLGSEVRVCLPNGTWSGTETKCLGPYDFDNNAQVREILKAKLDEKFDAEYREMQKYQQAVAAMHADGHPVPSGRMLDLSYEGRLILYFAFDVSGSVGEKNFRKSIDFAKAIVRKVGVSEQGTRVGALKFSSKAEYIFFPMQLKTTEEVLNNLDNITYTGGGTSATSALSLIKENMGLHDNYFPDDNKKFVVFFITDGKANMGGKPDTEAEELKKAGVEIYCIGITGDVRVDSLYKIASSSEFSYTSHEKRPNVFILENYASMVLLIQDITNGTIDYSQCGLGKEDIVIENRGRIPGGDQSVKPWPWMAALYFYPQNSRSIDELKFKCGGSIINQNFILTAAHCMYEEVTLRRRDKEEIVVKLGLTDIKNKTLVQDFKVKEMYIHSEYQFGKYYDYDIAFLQLDRPIQFTAYVRPICLPPKELPPNAPFYNDNEYGWVIGWGYEGIVAPGETKITFSMADILKELRLPIQSTEKCTKSLENRSFKTEHFTERMFCAGDGKIGNDTCKGDSGGPLMQSWMNPEGYIYWTQVGIVSWGIGCGIENTYGYYTHVHSLRSWIEEIINVAPTFENEISEGGD